MSEKMINPYAVEKARWLRKYEETKDVTLLTKIEDLDVKARQYAEDFMTDLDKDKKKEEAEKKVDKKVEKEVDYSKVVTVSPPIPPNLIKEAKKMAKKFNRMKVLSITKKKQTPITESLPKILKSVTKQKRERKKVSTSIRKRPVKKAVIKKEKKKRPVVARNDTNDTISLTQPLVIYLDNKTKKQFKIYCANKGRTMSKEATDIIRSIVEE